MEQLAGYALLALLLGYAVYRIFYKSKSVKTGTGSKQNKDGTTSQK